MGTRFFVDAEDACEYLFHIRTENESTVTFRFVPLDTTPVAKPLTLGELIEDEIDIPGRVVRYDFEGTAGQVVYFDTYESDFDPITSRLIGPDGSVVRFANADLEGLFVLPQGGTYHLDFIAQEGYVGDFKFKLFEVDDVLPAPLNTEIEAAITVPRSTLIYSFVGEADQRLLFETLEYFDNNGALWTLYAADGEKVNSANFISAPFAATLPDTGEYFLVFDGKRSDALATFTFQITEATTTGRSLALDTYIFGEITEPGERVVYTFEGSAGQVLYFDSLDFEFSDENLIMKLAKPDGTVIVSVSDQSSGPAFILPEDGEYRFSITDNAITNTSDYPDFFFQLIDVSAVAPLVLDQPRTASLPHRENGSQESADAVFPISATANSRYQLQIPELDELPVDVLFVIYDLATGQYLYHGPDNPVSEMNLVFETAGDYVLVFLNDGFESTEFEFQLTATPNTPPEIDSISNRFVTGGTINPTVDIYFNDYYDGERTFPESLTFTTTSTNTSLVPNSAISLLPNTPFAPWRLLISPAPGQLGSTTITVTVIDEQGLSDSASFMFTVTNQAPNISFLDDFEGNTGDEITFEVSAYDPDAPLQTLRFSLTGAPVGATIDPLTGEFTWIPTVAGDFSFSVVVSDGYQSDSESITGTILEANHAPTSLTLNNTSIAENSPAGTTVGTLSGIDPNAGDTLRFRLINLDSPFTLTGNVLSVRDPLNFELQSSYDLTLRVLDLEGLSFTKLVTVTVSNVNERPINLALSRTTVSESSVIGTSVGSLSGADPDAGDPLTFSLVTTGVPFIVQGSSLRVNGALNAATTASYPLSIRVADAGGLTFDKVVTVTVTQVGNQAPEGVNDSFSINEDVVLTGVNVLTNDTDPEQNALTAEKLTNPSHGTVTLAASGAIVYTPALNYFGTDSFTYRARDSQSSSSTVTVTVTINSINDAPVGSSDTFVTLRETPLTISGGQGVLVNDDDIENSTLTATAVTQPGHGTVSLAADGGFVYIPAVGYQGPDSFTYRASDGSASSDPVTVNLQVNAVNRPPVVTSQTINLTTQVKAKKPLAAVSVIDPDAGQSFTYAIESGNSLGIFAISSNGTISIPKKATLKKALKSQTSFPLTIRVTDNGNPAASATGFVTFRVIPKTRAGA